MKHGANKLRSVFTQRHLSIGNLRMWVREAGVAEGVPLLLLHGLVVSGEAWVQAAQLLSKGYRVIVPDLPGSGRSDKPDTGYAVEKLANQVLGLIDALDLSQVVVVGHSFGGHVALAFALAHPERARSLVLVDAFGLGADICLDALEPLLQESNENNVRAFVSAMVYRRDRIPESLVLTTIRELSAPAAHSALYVLARSANGPEGQRGMLKERLGELQPRTLIIWGEHDNILPRHQGYEAALLPPEARFVVIPGCGHCPHIEQPSAVMRIICAFLDGQE